MRWLSVGMLVLGLTGCTAEGLVNSAYPDREVFRLRTADGSEVNSYACEKSTTDAETKNRAMQAHRYFNKRIDMIAEAFANEIIDGVDTGAEPDMAALTAKLESGAEAAVNETEKRYSCLFFDAT